MYNNLNYGYVQPMGQFGFMPNYQQQQQPQQQAQQPHTNKIYVSGIEGARLYNTPANSDCILLDNDNPILYQKIVDGNGHFDVKVFDIVPHEEKSASETQTIDTSKFVSVAEFEALKGKFEGLENKIKERASYVSGTTRAN